MTSIVWFRNDLRLADNPALCAAAARKEPVVALYIDDDAGEFCRGAASRWWLARSLQSLDESLRGNGNRLVIRRGDALEALRVIVDETKAKAVFWNRSYRSDHIARDTKIKQVLTSDGLHARSFNAALLFEPDAIRNSSGEPFRVFTPFWKRCLDAPEPDAPLPVPQFAAPPRFPRSVSLKELKLEPQSRWSDKFEAVWKPGEREATRRATTFLRAHLSAYDTARNRPDVSGTSRLSPHLHFGEISARQVLNMIRGVSEARRDADWRRSQFVTELGWREFAHHLLYHFPATAAQPLRPAFAQFPWRNDPFALRAWQRGQTGFPIVDAGMRELWATGWMHNRVRMIVASFLVKDLLLSWNEGARWFWDTLVDADLANNTLGWQWAGGCGADAAPYFRIFNPARQGARFDPEGAYVRKWIPEIAALPDKWIHQPDAAPADVLREANVELGRDYPNPIVNHSRARKEALEAFARIKSR